MKLDELGTEWRAMRVEAGATAKSSVLVAKSIALVTLIFCLLIAFGLFISQAVRAFDFGSLSGYLIYCVVTWLLARDIYRAKPVSVELAGRDAEAPAIGAFNFTVLVIVIVFLMTLTLPALAFGAFDSGYLIYCVITSLLAWGWICRMAVEEVTGYGVTFSLTGFCSVRRCCSGCHERTRPGNAGSPRLALVQTTELRRVDIEGRLTG
jgi:hypothetical protein